MTLTSIVKKVQAMMEENWFIDTGDSLDNEIWSFVFSDCLHIEDELNQMRRGSYCSMFNYEEIQLVERYDPNIARYMSIIWEAENDWCTDLDELPLELDCRYEDDPEEYKLTYDRYRDQIEILYLDEKWLALELLDNYVTRKYAKTIQVSTDASRWDQQKNYFHYDEPDTSEQIEKINESGLSYISPPVQEDCLDDFWTEDEATEFAEDLPEQEESTGYTDASPGDEIFIELTEETPLSELKLSVRSYNCLRRAGIDTIMQLAQMDAEALSQIRNLGLKSQKEVKDKLNRLGLSLKELN